MEMGKGYKEDEFVLLDHHQRSIELTINRFQQSLPTLAPTSTTSIKL